MDWLNLLMDYLLMRILMQWLKFGGAYKVQSIPEGLKVIQRGQNLMHFEIVPEYAMSLENYQALLYQVQLVLT